MTAKSVEDYVQSLSGWQAQVASALCALVMEAVPEAADAIKWGQPVFEFHGQLCYFKAFKNHINFGFFHGDKLGDPDGLLEGSGPKMRHAKITNAEDFENHRGALRALVLEAAQLNLGNGG